MNIYVIIVAFFLAGSSTTSLFLIQMHLSNISRTLITRDLASKF